MARNMQKMINKNRGRLPERYCMTVKEFKALIDVAKQGDCLSPIEDSFIYGFILGSRAAQGGHFKERK